MRVRVFELRLLAAVLTTLWTIAAGLVLLGYRPGGPIDLLVGVLAATPIPISLAGAIWPPAARGDRAFAGVVWLGLGAILLLVPSIAGIAGQLLARGPQTLLPSLEAAYPWLLALTATSLFSCLGVARRLLGETAMRRRRLALGSALALFSTIAGGALFATAALANDDALRDRPAFASRFGPTLLEPPATACADPVLVAPSAVVLLTLVGDVDGTPIGRVDLRGERSGADGRWSADVATDEVIGQHGLARVDGVVWNRTPGRGWAESDESGAGVEVDRNVVERVLDLGKRAAAEDRGLEYIEGARARHCRIAIDGPGFLIAFPQTRWLSIAERPDLHRWRGQVDFWVFGDQQVGQVRATINGEAVGLGRSGIQGTIRADLIATDRGVGRRIAPPAGVRGAGG